MPPTRDNYVLAFYDLGAEAAFARLIYQLFATGLWLYGQFTEQWILAAIGLTLSLGTLGWAFYSSNRWKMFY